MAHTMIPNHHAPGPAARIAIPVNVKAALMPEMLFGDNPAQ
jgi:hypothetical protein